MRIAVAMSMAIIFASIGDVFFSRGMQCLGEVRFGGVRCIPSLVKRVVSNPFVVAGAFSMAIHLCAYVAVLSWVDVSVANPLTALSYVLATAYTVVFMRESVCFQRWLGVLLITAGAVLVGYSP